MKDNDFNTELDFVVSHYDKDAFSSKRAWMNIMGRSYNGWRRKLAIVAASCGIIMASAFIYNSIRLNTSHPDPAVEVNVDMTDEGVENNPSVAHIEFSNARLSEVVDKIESTYGVRVTNVPPDEMSITLNFHGSAPELIEVINETLQIDLKIEKEEIHPR